MPGKLAGATRPISAFGLVFVPTCRTLARGSSFGASEAHDMGGFGLVREIGDIFAIFPQGHALIVVSATLLVTHPMRIANEERSNVVLHTEVDHLASGFVPQISNAALCSSALLVLRTLQPLPTTRRLLASRLLLGNLAQLLLALSFERANATPGHDEGFAGRGGDSCKVDLAEIDGGCERAGSFCCLWSFDAHMQLKPLVPDQAARAAVFGQRNGQDQGWASFAHRQDHTPMFFAHRLRGPLDGIKAFGAPGILHLHLGMGVTKLACGLDIGKEGGNHHLHRLAVQGKTPFGGFLQRVSSWPGQMGQTCSFMHLHTAIPYLCSFHLSSFEALELFV